jgi:hypothetical protein
MWFFYTQKILKYETEWKEINNCVFQFTLFAEVILTIRPRRQKTLLRHSQQHGSFGLHNKTTTVKGHAVGKEQRNSS